MSYAPPAISVRLLPPGQRIPFVFEVKRRVQPPSVGRGCHRLAHNRRRLAAVAIAWPTTAVGWPRLPSLGPQPPSVGRGCHRLAHNRRRLARRGSPKRTQGTRLSAETSSPGRPQPTTPRPGHPRAAARRPPQVADDWLMLTSLLPDDSLQLPARRVLPDKQLLLAEPSLHRLRALFVTNSLFDVQLALRVDDMLSFAAVPDLSLLLGNILAMGRVTYVMLPCTGLRPQHYILLCRCYWTGNRDYVFLHAGFAVNALVTSSRCLPHLSLVFSYGCQANDTVWKLIATYLVYRRAHSTSELVP